jgi:hypothetical protein
MAALGACNQQTPISTETSTVKADTLVKEETIVNTETTMEVKKGQSVYFPNLSDGQEISLPYIVEFGVKGMEVEPAQMANPDKGHHHLLIDKAAVPAGEMVPMGKEGSGYYHFGKGQLRDTLTVAKYPMLTKGTHKLRLQFANGMHQSYGPAMSQEVLIIIR